MIFFNLQKVTKSGVLRLFKGFSHFKEMSDIINRLEDHVASARMKTTPVIDFEKNESLKGLDIGRAHV